MGVTRLITKQMRNSFNLGTNEKITIYMGVDLIDGIRSAGRVGKTFRLAHKQRILILRGIIK